MRALKLPWRRRVAVLTAGVAVLAGATPALAATNSPKPVLANWGVWKSCGTTYPGQNCAQVRATAENAGTHTLYAVGDFTEAINDAGTSSAAYKNLVAINETTGAVVSTFPSHNFNGRIYAVTVDPGTGVVYVAGDFTRIDGSGTHAQHVAAFDGSTGKLLNFNARTNGSVRALLLANGRLYVGGNFTAVQSTSRSHLAALDPGTGALVSGFVPPTIAWSGTNQPDVRSVVLGVDANGAQALYVGGHFDTAGGAAHMSLMRINPTSGALDAGFAPKLDVTSGDSLQAVDSMAWVNGSQDGTPSILVAQAGHTNRAYRFDTKGNRMWYLLPDGDMQTVVLSGTTVYFGGHFTCIASASPSCFSGGGVTRVHIASVDLTAGTIQTDFKPRMDPSSAPYFFGVWSLELTANGTLWAGGVFKQVTVSGVTYSRPKLAAFPPL